MHLSVLNHVSKSTVSLSPEWVGELVKRSDKNEDYEAKSEAKQESRNSARSVKFNIIEDPLYWSYKKN